MKNELSIGIVGAGGFAAFAATAFLQVPGIKIAAVTDVQPEASQNFAQAFQAKVYPEYESFLEDPKIDLVYIATPPYLHFEQSKLALLAGKHVICEKPATLKTKEVEELRDKELICYAYDASARHLLDYIKSKNSKKDSKPQFTDSPFLMYSLEEPNRMLEIAESLAAKSSRLWRENLNAARRYIDAPYLTNSEVMDLREERLADFLNIQGQSLLLQNKFAEARKILEEAVTRSKQKNALINQNYVEALIKSGNIKASIEAMKVMMSNGKSTESIDKFYAQYTNSTIDSLKITSLNSAKKRLEERLINRDAPDFVFHDVSGREVHSGCLLYTSPSPRD